MTKEEIFITEETEEKKNKSQSLEKSIKEKKLQIQKLENEVRSLQHDYNELNESQLPILLFFIKESIEMRIGRNFDEYKYIYYCPDLDKVKYIINPLKNEFLPNTIDLRDAFKKFGVPEEGITFDKYSKQIEQAISILKEQIDSLFASNEINSISDLAEQLTNWASNDGPSKVLKK